MVAQGLIEQTIGGDDPQTKDKVQQPYDADENGKPASSSSDEFKNTDTLSLRELRHIREIDAETIIAPVISRTQTTALYAVAASPRHSPAPSASPQLENEDLKLPGPLQYSSRESVAASFCDRAVSIGGLNQRQSKKQAQKNLISFSLPSIQLPSLTNVSLSSFMTDFTSSVDKDKRKRARTMNFPEPTQEKEHGKIGPLPLRRASSVSSIHRRLSRVGSTTSSIGDDAQFLHIHSMTNSRLKAIKDNLIAGLPTIPQLPYLQQQLANFNPFSDPVDQSSPGLVSRDSSPALEALDNVLGDVVVIGGYRGSILRDKAGNNRRVWIPLKVGLNLRKVDLEVGLEPDDDEKMLNKIQADGMLTHIGPVDISRRLLRRLRNGAIERGRRVHDWGYDWRLSPSLLTRRLIKFLEALPCNQERNSGNSRRKGALVIAHSFGGLLVRSAMNIRPDLFSGVIYAGTPMHCVNILGPLRNGDSVLLNSKVFTAQVNFTLRSSYAFLPEDGHCFIDRQTGEPIPLDFFDVKIWQEFGLSPCVSDIKISPPSAPISLPRIPIPNPPTVLKPLKFTAEKEKYPESLVNAAMEPRDRTLAPQMRGSRSSNIIDQVTTIPKSKAISYLTRILAETLEFKKSLHYRQEIAERYPPMAVLYAKTTPTVRGARVNGRKGINSSDVYDDLVFGAGDGVCLARAAMLPEGYHCCKKVSVDRGHVSLLGDLEGVGKCLQGLVAERGW